MSVVAVSVVIAAATLGGLALNSRRPQPPAAERSRAPPKLLLLTSLPIIFNEDFGLRGGGSPAPKALSKSYRVLPISVTSPAELAKGDLLLMAQPQAQTPENLVTLDDWVRRGGRVLLLADPMLEWPSKRALGDVTRPPPMFADTGLLAHWGLQLDTPDERGLRARKLGRYRVMTASPGHLQGKCDVSDDGFEAHCRLGSGQATIIADADFLNTAALESGAEHNLDALLEQLATLARL